MEALCFDVWGPYGTFRVPATTRGYITYPLIPRTAAVGLIAAMLGVERNRAYEKDHYLYNAKIGIQCLNEPSTISFRTNLIQTKNLLKKKGTTFFLPSKPESSGYRSPMTEVFLKNPKFRFFVFFKEKLDKLEERLKKKEFHYNPYFGRNNLFCYPEYKGNITLSKCTINPKKIITLFEATVSEEFIDGNFSLIFGVPMNYSVKNGKISLNKVATIAYHISELTINSKELESYTIEESRLPEIKGKQITFLPWE